jgi:hypothetical protein
MALERRVEHSQGFGQFFFLKGIMCWEILNEAAAARCAINEEMRLEQVAQIRRQFLSE